jgi:hypothetical protein
LSNTLYWLLSSMSLAFWFTTRIGSVKIVPPPCATPDCTPARWTSVTTFSVGRFTVGTGWALVGGSTA